MGGTAKTSLKIQNWISLWYFSKNFDPPGKVLRRPLAFCFLYFSPISSLSPSAHTQRHSWIVNFLENWKVFQEGKQTTFKIEWKFQIEKIKKIFWEENKKKCKGSQPVHRSVPIRINGSLTKKFEETSCYLRRWLAAMWQSIESGGGVVCLMGKQMENIRFTTYIAYTYRLTRALPPSIASSHPAPIFRDIDFLSSLSLCVCVCVCYA